MFADLSTKLISFPVILQIFLVKKEKKLSTCLLRQSNVTLFLLKFQKVKSRPTVKQIVAKTFLLHWQRKILRVGNRLVNSNARHPTLLPKDSPFTTLVIRYTHLKHLHAGHKTTQYLLSQNFSIVSFRSIKMRCFFKANPVASTPLMGNLPQWSFQQVKAFHSIGVDFASLFTITMNRVCGEKPLSLTYAVFFFSHQKLTSGGCFIFINWHFFGSFATFYRTHWRLL